MPFRTDLGRIFSMVGEYLSHESKAPFRSMLEAHFGCDPSLLPTVNASFEPADLPNLQSAVEHWLASRGHPYQTHGVTTEYEHIPLNLSLLASSSQGYAARSLSLGPVTYTNVTLHNDTTLSCAQNALHLSRTSKGPIALLQRYVDQGFRRLLTIELMAAERSDAEAVLAELRNVMREQNVYRGHVVSLGLNKDGSLHVNFHRLPSITRERVILPTEVLARIERQSFAYTKHREELLRSGRHLKRGMLLHGPPGTGKTFTAMYLAAQMKERTVLLVTGRQQGLIGPCCAMARLLQPSTVILEDVDLIATDRNDNESCNTPVLFELLNEMDGLREDADVLFVLTTNRPEALEPALAARPGRVDLAVEVPLPDSECRRQLINLYGKGLSLALSKPDWLVDRTEGVSAAFIKELLRRAALVAADTGHGHTVQDAHVEDALRELLSDRDRLTRTLLGASQAKT